MDKTKALQNLLQGKATKKEIELLKQALASGEISIGGDMNRSVVIIGSGNKVELTAEALSLLKPETKTEELAAGEPPYMGLRYFDTSDVDLFYGRETLTRELLLRVEKEPFLAIVGASGSGKSSVARAGLVPAWKGENEHGAIHVITPTAHPLESLAASLTRDSESVTATSTLMDDISKDARSLRLYVKKTLGETKLLLLVDQFEETFTLCKDQTERKVFIENLLLLADEDGMARVVITLRADFYHHCAEYEGLRLALDSHQKYIGAMTADELRQAITVPAEKNGWDFQPGLVDLILADVGTEPGALPLLSHALLETWKRRQGRMLTLQGYAEAGGVKKAIAQTAESVYDRLTPAEQTIARGIFLRLTELGEGTQDTRRRVKLDELAQTKEQDTVAKVLKTLADARLVTTEQDSAEVAHEALIREWGTLRKWLDEDRENLRLLRHLSESAMEWERRGKDEAFLDHRGGRLDEALSFEDNLFYKYSETEKAYLKACVAYQMREQNRRNRLRRQITYGLGVGFFVMLVIAIVAGVQWKRAENQTQIAFARQLATQAKLLTLDNETMLIQRNLLSIESIQKYPTLEAQQNLNDIFLYSPLVSVQLNQMDSIVLSQDKKLLVGVRKNESTIQVWDISVGRVRFLLSYPGIFRSCRFYSNGKWLEVFADNYIYYWNMTTGQQINPYGGGGVISVRDFSPDGDLVAYTREPDTGFVYIRNISAQQEMYTLLHGGEVLRVNFSPDGNFLATWGANDVHVWDVSTGKEKFYLSGVDDFYTATFSPDGNLFVMKEKKNVYLWDIATGQEKAHLLLTEEASDAYFSPDGKSLAASDGKIIRLWDTSTGQEKVHLLHSEYAYVAVFSPNGKLLAASDGKIVHLWDTSTGQEKAHLLHSEYVYGVVFSPNGKVLATSDGKIVHLWDVSNGLEISQMLLDYATYTIGFDINSNYFVATSTITATIWQLEKEWQPYNLESIVAVSHNRKMMVSASSCPPKEICQVTIRILDTVNGREIFRTDLSNGPSGSAAFSDSDEYIAISDEKLMIHVWKISTGQEVTRIVSPAYVYGSTFGTIGNLLAFNNYQDHTIYVWDMLSGELITSLANSGSGFDLSSERKLLGFSGLDNNIYIWDLLDNHQTIQISNAGTNNLVFSPNGEMLATYSNNDKSIHVWDASTGKERGYFLHDMPVTSFVFDFDGRLLATVSNDKVVHIWDISSGKEVTHMVHDGFITNLAFNSSGNFLVTGSSDKTARVWDVRTGREIARMLHNYQVSLVAFDSDEKKVISSGGTTRIWLWQTKDLVNEICKRTPRNFTRAEWDYYFPNEDYRATCPNVPPEPEPMPTSTMPPMP